MNDKLNKLLSDAAAKAPAEIVVRLNSGVVPVGDDSLGLTRTQLESIGDFRAGGLRFISGPVERGMSNLYPSLDHAGAITAETVDEPPAQFAEAISVIVIDPANKK